MRKYFENSNIICTYIICIFLQIFSILLELRCEKQRYKKIKCNCRREIDFSIMLITNLDQEKPQITDTSSPMYVKWVNKWVYEYKLIYIRVTIVIWQVQRYNIHQYILTFDYYIVRIFDSGMLLLWRALSLYLYKIDSPFPWWEILRSCGDGYPAQKKPIS